MKDLFILANKNKDEFVSMQNNKININDNINFAYCFESVDEALLFEDKFSNDISILTYIYKVDKDCLSEIDYI